MAQAKSLSTDSTVVSSELLVSGWGIFSIFESLPFHHMLHTYNHFHVQDMALCYLAGNLLKPLLCSHILPFPSLKQWTMAGEVFFNVYRF
jgi:hypothetical protein